ncbi:glycoside hydrolase family 43 protein [Hymenobacter cavernae]|nr:glycoside hydrolase family 43 protein [Hymenobacter cavernae]
MLTNLRQTLCAGALLFSSYVSLAQQPLKKNEVLLFAYFKGNGEDGLHLASSPDGYKWTPLHNDSTFLRPTVANDKLMRDPCIIRGVDGQFHMVWTVSWKDKGIGYASSKDLIHWSEQQFLPVMAKEEGTRNTWAPEITYDPASKQYMIYWASTITGRFPETQTSADASYNHRLYYVTTKDFKTYSETKLLYNPGFNSIDATIVPDGKRYVMFLKDETREPAQKNLRVAIGNQLTGPYELAATPITGKYWAEGPTAVNLGAKWLVYFDKYTLHKYGAIQSTDLKNWTDVSDQVHFPAGARHGTVLRITKKELDKLNKNM